MSDETRARFLAAIARQLPAERVIEAHLFSAMRQGGMESGVAVIALERFADEAAFVAGETTVDESPYADESPHEAHVIPEAHDDRASEPLCVDGDAPVSPMPASRYTIYSACYRYTLKGLDRGKWEVSVTEEADAPLLTVDAVVRGVQRRSGDADEVVRLSGDEFRAALPTVQPAS